MHDRSLAGVAMERPSTRLGLVLGVLSALGPLAMDLYLPAFPMMVRDLASSPGEVQRTLSVFLLALACAQIPVGSLSDRHGRKLALYCGIGLFVIATGRHRRQLFVDLVIGARVIRNARTESILISGRKNIACHSLRETC
jgi:MFS family permease